MGTTVQDMLKRFKALNVPRAGVTIIEKNQDTIMNYNRANLYKGQYKQGDFLAPYKDKYYAAKKLKLNTAGVTDLKLTGEYYESFKLKVTETTFEIFSDLEKAERLTALYGSDINGISDEDKQNFKQDFAQPGIVQYIREQTGCK